MSWQQNKASKAEAVWSGQDGISNMWYVPIEARHAFSLIGLWPLGVCMVFGGLAALSPIVDFFARAMTFGDETVYWVSSPPQGGCRSLFSACATEPLLWLLLGLTLLGAGVAVIIFAATKAKPGTGIFRSWKLTATASELFYDAGPFSAPLDPYQVARKGSHWSVLLNAVARVEAGRTVEWDSVRRYEGKPMDSREGFAKIPDVEYQVFLFMADGSRRVIYTVNGDREDAGTLAHSIRSWIEAQRDDVRLDQERHAPATGFSPAMEGYVV